MNCEVRFQGPVSPQNKRVQSFQEEPMIFLFLCGVLPTLVDAIRISSMVSWESCFRKGGVIYTFICFVLLWWFVETESQRLERTRSPAFVSCCLWVALTMLGCSQLSTGANTNKHQVLVPDFRLSWSLLFIFPEKESSTDLKQDPHRCHWVTCPFPDQPAAQEDWAWQYRT